MIVSEDKSEGPRCSHLEVGLRPRQFRDGSHVDRWVCMVCGDEFVGAWELAKERLARMAAERELKDFYGDVTVAAEQAEALRAALKRAGVVARYVSPDPNTKARWELKLPRIDHCDRCRICDSSSTVRPIVGRCFNCGAMQMARRSSEP